LSRNIGLDLARSLAIVMVLISHSRMFFDEVNLQWVSFNGLIGVELFFVLSGFLIGQIIIKDVLFKGSYKSLYTFYQRRWFRTLPVYFLVMMVVAVVSKRNPHWTNFLFMQNFNGDFFLPVSWSLSIEEWFYLIIPPVFIIALFKSKSRTGFWFVSACVAIILIFTVIRFTVVFTYSPSWDFGVRKQIYLRFDSIMVGVLLAGIKLYYSDFYNKLTKNRIMLNLLALSSFIFVIVFYIFTLDAGGNVMDSSLFGRTFFFNVIPLSCALVVLSLSSSSWIESFPRNKRSVKFIYFVSVTSYSVYLVHYELFVFVRPYIMMYGVLTKLLLLAVLIIITYVISFIIYKYYESPFLRLRDKLTIQNTHKTNFGS